MVIAHCRYLVQICMVMKLMAVLLWFNELNDRDLWFSEYDDQSRHIFMTNLKYCCRLAGIPRNRWMLRLLLAN
jgi:hypothetical protein